MTYAADEASVASGRPVELVDYACGATHWPQCSGPLAIVYGGRTYEPQAGLRVGATEDSGNVLRSTCDIECEWDNPLVALYPGTPPDSVITVAIYRIQNAEYVAGVLTATKISPWWSGYLGMVERRERPRAVVHCAADSAASGRGSLCLRTGRLCQVPLYSELCGLDQEDWEVEGTIDAVDACEVMSSRFLKEFDGVTDAADQYYRGGPITVNGYGRLVLDHQGDTIALSEAVPGLAAGQTFTAAPGCNHLMSGCLGFDNLDNFIGDPNLPTEKNPYTEGVY